MDTDGDAIPDSIDSDDDNDGLSAVDENLNGTNLINSDSNGDGLADEKESSA